jgi:hypothetical protein
VRVGSAQVQAVFGAHKQAGPSDGHVICTLRSVSSALTAIIMPIVPSELHIHILDLYIESIASSPGCVFMLRDPARVCTLWLERCRRELFKVVVIDDGSYRNILAWPRLLFLILNPHLATYVTTVRIRSASAAEDALECLKFGFPNVHTLMYEVAEFKPLDIAFVIASFFPKLTAFGLTGLSLFYIGILPRIAPTFPAIHRFDLDVYSTAALSSCLNVVVDSPSRETLRSIHINLSHAFSLVLGKSMQACALFASLSYLSVHLNGGPAAILEFREREGSATQFLPLDDR